MSYTPTDWMPDDVVTATRMNKLENAVGDMNMSYTPNVWENGDVVTAAKMNALEQAVASGGGEGSSDLSTATVIITDNTDGYHVFDYLICIENDEDLVPGIDIYGGDTKTIKAILYNGMSASSIQTSDTVAVTGDIEYDSEYGDLYITGDGTITIS